MLSATYTQAYETTSYSVSSISPSSPYSRNPPMRVQLNTDDNWSTIYDLKLDRTEDFNFCFFGNTFNKCLMNTNGVMTFSIAGQVPGGVYTPLDGTGWSLSAGQSIPSAPTSNTVPLYRNAIFGPFQDMIMSPTTDVNIAVIGSFPNRVFVFNINDVPMFSCSTVKQTSQIVLHEGTNIIDVYVIKRDNSCAWNGGKAVIGIQNNDGTQGYTPPNRNTGNWNVPSTTPEAWRFTPNGNNVTPTFVWRNSLGTIVGTGQNITVNPTATETYTVTATYTNCTGTAMSVTDSTTVGVNQIQAGEPVNLAICSENGNATFDLTLNNANILDSLDPFQYELTYHTTLASVDSDTALIANPSAFVSSGQIIYARVQDLFTPNACYTIKVFDVVINPTPAAPTGNTNQVFTSGQTLADLVVVGDNIQWYGSNTGNDMLPNSTQLVVNTTYHASQTNAQGCEGDRLSVTAVDVLNIHDFTEANFKVYPNPVKDVLNLSYRTQISSVKVYNLVGQEIVSKNLNVTQGQLDMSTLSTGTYIVKVNVDGLVKTIKVVKE